MRKFLGSLIVISPSSASIFKFRYTPTAIAVLAIVFAMTFSFIVALGYTFPPLVTDRERTLIEMENQQLKARNLNAQFGVDRLNNRLSSLENQSKRIQDLADTE